MHIPERLLEEIEQRIGLIGKEFSLATSDVLDILKRRAEDNAHNTIPISIFANGSLSALEAIVKYLKEEQRLDYRTIAELLGRNYGPIAITCRNAKRKHPERLNTGAEEKVPLSIFRNVKLSILESLATYLKDSLHLNYHQIALALNRDDRTIWTVCSRARKKEVRA
ncbi:TPA: hypothetical protein HA361_07390 [Candidatus Woesearchaeota archaeon]|nr:hypothetical protein [Candidatus Woesearchaeota archaeon]